MRSKGGLPAFAGARYQRGHGIGNTLRRLTKMALPEIKKNAKKVGKKVLATGINVMSDVMQGKSVRNSVKKRTAESVQEMLPKRGPPGERIKSKPKTKKGYKRLGAAKRMVIRRPARQQNRWKDALT